MAEALRSLDWTLIKSFLAVAETGSLSEAARQLGLSQPTLGRHIKSAEAALGSELFRRHASGFALTEAGMNLLDPAQDMARASARLMACAAGRDVRLSGTVRITASLVVSHCLLPRIIASLREQEPDIEIELAPSDAPENLTFRAADIAIRMFRPTQLDIVTRKISDHPLALYAAETLWTRYARPRSLEELRGVPFVGFDQSDMIIEHMRALGLQIDRHFFGVRCDNQVTYWALVCAGCGVGAMQTVIGDAQPGVERLALQPELPALPLWLAAQDSVYKSPRVKRVWDLLSEELSKLWPGD